MKVKIIFAAALIFTFATAFSQKENPTTWQTETSKKEVKAGETIELIFTADIKDDWYLYSSDFDKDLGPITAEFTFTPNDSYELVGGIQPVGAKSKEDKEIWMGTYTYFVKKAEFRQKVKILKENPQIKVKLYGQACSEITHQCVPVIQQFQFNDIKVTAAVAPEKHIQPATETGKAAPQTSEKSSSASSSKPKTEALKAEDFPSRLEYLKAEKERLVKTGPNGEDQARTELVNFVKKYGE